MVIIFFENGRLGNQLFQFHGLRKYYPNDLIFFFGFKSFQNNTNYKKIFYINKGLFSLILFKKFIQWVLSLLVNLRILTGVEEVSSELNYKLIKKSGIFNNIIYVKNSFFQHKDIQPKLWDLDSIEFSCSDRVVNFLEINKLKEKETVFVHIRRGDYLFWPSIKYPAAVSIDWYQKQMEYFRYKYNGIQFIVFSDDKDYVYKIFLNTKDVILSYEKENIDFCIMTKCRHGILSASSFSWWSAYLAKRTNPAGEFIAPKYWIGYNKKELIPLWIESNWIKYS